ncbi:LysR substrate binding domain-containing protein [Paraburkholderia tuberum]|uniref:LysR substrate binding domain-containing protein n=1 Tax=Paraburkholderia tuberum TaxID=157910 RepID=A0A1H1KB88_9BURK|nr:LysR substrate binding domain-containing protein [Paraburkholderia tuberum]
MPAAPFFCGVRVEVRARQPRRDRSGISGPGDSRSASQDKPRDLVQRVSGACKLVGRALERVMESLVDFQLHRVSPLGSGSRVATETGQSVYEAGLRIIGDFTELESSVGCGQVSLAGMVRVTVAPVFGRLYVVPRLPAFFARYPNVSVDLSATERTINLVEEGFDLRPYGTGSSAGVALCAGDRERCGRQPVAGFRAGADAHPRRSSCRPTIADQDSRIYRFRFGNFDV